MNDEHVRSMVSWENSEDFYHLITPVKLGDKRKKHTVESVKKTLMVCIIPILFSIERNLLVISQYK